MRPLFQNVLSPIKATLKVGKFLFIVLAVYFAVFAVFSHIFSNNKLIVRQSYSDSPMTAELFAAYNDPEMRSTENGLNAIKLMSSVTCSVYGAGCLTEDLRPYNDPGKGILGKSNTLISMTIGSPPASGLYWAHESLQKVGVVSSAYAAEGVGFGALKPISGLWKLFRDFMYLIIVIVIIAIGFMIMFRTKLDGQTAVNVQMALPKIAFALLAITFSYPIAGLMIDATYIVMGLVLTLFNASSAIAPPTKLMIRDMTTAVFTEQSGFSMMNAIFGGYAFNGGWDMFGSSFNIAQNFYYTLPDLFQQLLNGIAWNVFWVIVPFIRNFKFLRLLGSVRVFLDKFSKSGQLFGSALGAVGSFVLDLILIGIFGSWIAIGFMTVVILVTYLFLTLRMFFMFIKNYMIIILTIIFSPIMLSVEAIPGQSAFGKWLKNLGILLLTFPLALLLILTARAIMELPDNGNQLWAPPFLDAFSINNLQVIIGAAILFSIPEIIENIQKALGYETQTFGVNPVGYFGAGAVLTGGFTSALGPLGGITGAATAYKLLPAQARKFFEGKLNINSPNVAKEATEAIVGTGTPTGSGGGAPK